MNYRQATWLRPGVLIRRKEPLETQSAAQCAVLIVDRVEYPTRMQGEVTVHAGGHAFKASEIERVVHR